MIREDDDPLEEDDFEEDFEEDGEFEEDSVEDWADSVPCPSCGSSATRLVERHYELGLFECEECGSTFEEEA
jgi:predicted RNA-binding Zn-ribbon protein involved in translation (DUF1610 family)